MTILNFILLGIIQGLTEPIPVSSSGHIFLFKNMFETDIFNSLNFEIIANFGSFLAILFIFRKDVVDLINNFFKFIFDKTTRKKTKQKFKYCWLLVISTIPTLITGLLFKDFLDNKLTSLTFLAITFFITGVSLFLVRKQNGTKRDFDITYKDAIIIGLTQSIAIFPGISRSGAVLVGCLICKLNRESALKYTFLLYFPVSLGAVALGASDLINTSESHLIIPYIAGMISSLIITYFSYQWLSNWVKKGKLWYFSIYCLLLVIFILIYFR